MGLVDDTAAISRTLEPVGNFPVTDEQLFLLQVALNDRFHPKFVAKVTVMVYTLLTSLISGWRAMVLNNCNDSV